MNETEAPVMEHESSSPATSPLHDHAVEHPSSPASGGNGVPAAPLIDTVLEKLRAIEAPLTLPQLLKGLEKPIKKMKQPEFEAHVEALLAEPISARHVFVYPSGKADEKRLWGKDEKHLIIEAIVAKASASNKPGSKSSLIAAGRGASKGVDPAFVESILKELIAEHRLHEHPVENGDPLLSIEKHRPKSTREEIAHAILTVAATPITLKDLVPAALTHLNTTGKAVTDAAREMIGAQKLHVHGGTKQAPLYGSEMPKPPDRGAVEHALLTVSAQPQNVKAIVQAALAHTTEKKEFVEQVARELVESKRLHVHPGGKASAPFYGSHEYHPPHVLDVGPGQKELKKAVQAVVKVLEIARGASIEDVLSRLETALRHEASKPKPEPSTSGEVTHAETAAAEEPTQSPPE